MDRLTAAGLVGGQDVDEPAGPDDDELRCRTGRSRELLDGLLGGLGSEGDEPVDVEVAALGRCGDGVEPGDRSAGSPGSSVSAASVDGAGRAVTVWPASSKDVAVGLVESLAQPDALGAGRRALMTDQTAAS